MKKFIYCSSQPNEIYPKYSATLSELKLAPTGFKKVPVHEVGTYMDGILTTYFVPKSEDVFKIAKISRQTIQMSSKTSLVCKYSTGLSLEKQIADGYRLSDGKSFSELKSNSDSTYEKLAENDLFDIICVDDNDVIVKVITIDGQKLFDDYS